MTFKHVKFEDSPTMRALEKVAREKGLVKPEPLNKTASSPKKLDYKPTSNLMENMVKLCSGLRSQGLIKDAEELEINYLNYKQAQTLYETSKEKGEDVVQFAHPKGSHKLEDVDSDEAVVEDILDQHMKIIQMIDKKPTGKLASSKDVLKAVKKVLGQGKQELVEMTKSEIFQFSDEHPQQFQNWVQSRMGDMIMSARAQAGAGLTAAQQLQQQGHLDEDVAFNIGHILQRAIDAGQDMAWGKNINMENLRQIQAAYTGAKQVASSDINDANTKSAVMNAMDAANGTISILMTAVQSWVTNKNQIPPGIPTPKKPKPVGVVTIPEVNIEGKKSSGPLSPIYSRIEVLKAQLNTWSTVPAITGSPKASAWISKEISVLNTIMDGMDKNLDEAAEKEATPYFQSALNKEEAKIQKVKAWLDSKAGK